LRLTIKALGWIIILLWIITLTLPFSAALSLLKLAEGRNLGVQEPTFTFSNGNISITMPVYINNTGFYDITEANVKIRIWKENVAIADMLASLPEIPAGQMVNASCTFTTNFREIFQKDRTLLTKDANLNVNATLRFQVAHLIAFSIARVFPTQWGAPFHNLTVYGETYNSTGHVLSFYISFNNHAFFSISGFLTVGIFNSAGETVGMTSMDLNVPYGVSFMEFVEVAVDPSKMTGDIYVRLFFADLEVFERMIRL